MSENISAQSKRLVPWLVGMAFFMEFLDSTILNTAVPTMATALGVVPLSMKSVLSSYTLCVAVFIPISSWVADRYGTRRVFATAIGVFTLGSLLCGISSNLKLLVLWRMLQGCGGALMVPVGRLTLVRAFPRSELIRAMTFLSIPALIGPMLGPLVGGLIVTYFNWRFIFFVNLPIGILGLYLVYKHLPNFFAEKVPRLDTIGLILFSSGVALLSYVLEVFGEHTLSGLEISSLFFLSLILLAGYGLHSRQVKFPLLRLHLMRLRTMRSSIVGNFITRLGAGGMPFLLPLLYQLGLGFSPVESGLLIMPQPIAALCFKMTIPHILRRYGYRNVLLLNTACVGLLIASFASLGPGSHLVQIVVLGAAFGFFSSLQFTSMNTLVYADVPEADTGMASTIASTAQQMALSFGVATASLTAAYFIPDRLHATVPDLIHGLHSAFYFLGALTVASGAVFFQLRPEDGSSLSQHKSSTTTSMTMTEA